MSKKKEQIVKQELDPATQAMQEEIYNRARQVSQQPFTAYNGQTVAGASPLSREGVDGMRAAQDQLAYLYQSNLNAGDRAQMYGQELANLGHGFGQRAQGLQGGLGFDAAGQRMQDWAGSADQRAAGMDQWGQRFGDYANTGTTGARALGGDAAATQALMNPYQQEVLNAVGADFDRQRAQAHTQANQAATAAGAFGGSRHGIMEGARLGELDAAQLSTMANLRQSGFNDAMGRANQAANLGFGAGELDLSGRQLGQADRAQGLQAHQVGQGYNQLGMDARQLGATYDNMGLDARGLGLQAQNLGLGALGQAQGAAQAGSGVAGQLFGAGDYYRNIEQQYLADQQRRFNEARDWDVRNFDLLKSGITGVPYGSSTTQTMDSDPWSQLLGAGLTIGGFALGGPAGAYAGNQIGGRIG